MEYPVVRKCYTSCLASVISIDTQLEGSPKMLNYSPLPYHIHKLHTLHLSSLTSRLPKSIHCLTWLLFEISRDQTSISMNGYRIGQHVPLFFFSCLFLSTFSSSYSCNLFLHLVVYIYFVQWHRFLYLFWLFEALEADIYIFSMSAVMNRLSLWFTHCPWDGLILHRWICSDMKKTVNLDAKVRIARTRDCIWHWQDIQRLSINPPSNHKCVATWGKHYKSTKNRNNKKKKREPPETPRANSDITFTNAHQKTTPVRRTR